MIDRFSAIAGNAAALAALWVSSGALSDALGADTQAGVKFAFYSASWQENNQDSLRVLAFNPFDTAVRIESIDFVDLEAPGGGTLELDIALDVPAGGYAEREMAYIDLLGQGECVGETLAGNWRLVEISNYTLNPSVRNLIIENTESFRIYQCVQTVATHMTKADTGITTETREWVLYHFESLADH